MKTVLTIQTAREFFASLVDQVTRETETLQVSVMVQAMVDFYRTTVISGVDATDTDADTLLFEYGTYDWSDGKGERFTIGVTRQFQLINDEEYYQLRCNLAFAADFARDLPPCTSWLWDYPTLDAWQAAIQATPGAIKAQAAASETTEIELDMT